MWAFFFVHLFTAYDQLWTNPSLGLSDAAP